jgi:hypothetical protein
MRETPRAVSLPTVRAILATHEFTHAMKVDYDER